MHGPNGNDEKIIDEDGIARYPRRSNIPFIKPFGDKVCLIINENM